MNDLVIPTPALAAEQALNEARQAGQAWAGIRVVQRLAVVRRARRLMARRAAELAASVTGARVGRPVADTLVAEVLPLLEAARFLERRAAGLLAPRRLRGGRPLWLLGVHATLSHEPLGAVLILAPGNYPLFLPGAQALQALVAGNAVCWKPAPEGVAAAHACAAILHEAGLPRGVLQVLGAEDGPAAAAAGYDRIVLTGAAETGALVLAAAAPHLTPTTMELSGSDAAFVLPGADLVLVARCLAYGLRLNGGATCIAPRRVFVTRDRAAALETALRAALPGVPDAVVPPAVAGRLQALLTQAVGMGGRAHRDGPARPALLMDARPEMPLLQQDVFAPWLSLVPVGSMAEALRADARCPFALGASVFGPADEAAAFARQVRAGSVCVNDLIVPTADPRLPFGAAGGGGRGRSGFGRTRGAEGLLEFTATKAISVRRGWFRPHLASPGPADAARFAMLCRVLHGGFGR